MNSWNHLNCPNFTALRLVLSRLFIDQSHEVHTAKWQGVDISRDPSAKTHELLNVGFTVDLKGIEHLSHWQADARPNLPWADDHFAERVCGAPINPGVTWKTWPWGGNAEKFLDARGMFNHNYMQRYWPRHAGQDLNLPSRTSKEWHEMNMSAPEVNYGIDGEYGDLHSLVQLLIEQPDTRQAWLPIFFPEDTGNTNPGRKPCSLGYQFILREDKLHVYYPLRSCDFAKHFADDIYLTIRLLLWVLNECRSADAMWNAVEPGSFTMHCTSLHLFTNDMITLKRDFGEL